MKQSIRERKRFEAQELMWNAMDVINGGDEQKAAKLCHKALGIYPDCVDAMTMLAEIKCERINDYVDDMRKAVEAGRRDLGPKCFEEDKGHFWGLIETRPFMRAMAQLAHALRDWGASGRIDEAIEVFEEMLALNPNDNQGVRDPLVGGYLARKRYDDARGLLTRYKEDCFAVHFWAQVLLAYATQSEAAAAKALKKAREVNQHVEVYLTGRKPRPRTRPGYYSLGDENEALYCADTLWEAWKAHREAKWWLKGTHAAKG
jgi:tetratricopeptide (TPR) repeat protein